MKNLLKNIADINDLWLIAFFVIQLAYILAGVFSPLPANDDKSVIDVVIRTSTAALAGYFMSKNFVTKNQLISTGKSNRVRHIVQSCIVGCVGLFCISVILTVRFASAVALPYNTLSQLRDFYLAAIAFLMGTSE